MGGVSATGYDDRVVLIFGEGVAVVMRVGNVLSLVLGDIDGVDCDHAVGLVASSMTPVLVASDVCGRVVLIIQVIYTIFINIHAIGIICKRS